MLPDITFLLSPKKNLAFFFDLPIVVVSIVITITQNDMTKNELKKEIEKLAEDTNSTFIEAASAMQTACVQSGNEELIPVIGEMKLEFLGL